MAQRLDLCFSSCNLSADDVEQLMSRYKKNPEDAKDAFKSTYTKLHQAARAEVASKKSVILQSTVSSRTSPKHCKSDWSAEHP